MEAKCKFYRILKTQYEPHLRLILGFEDTPQVAIASPTKLLAVPDLGV
jgi:hypothetical protein